MISNKLDSKFYKCKSCNFDNQAHLVDANKYANQIESIILKSQKRDLAKKRADEFLYTNFYSDDELRELNSEISELESLVIMAQKCFEQFLGEFDEKERETLSLCSFTENAYLIKLYECLLELYIRAKCYSKAICVTQILLIIYK